jgi:hypothetical protein
MDTTETAALKLWLAAARQENTKVNVAEDEDLIDALVQALSWSTQALTSVVGEEAVVEKIEGRLADQGELAPVLKLIPGRRPNQRERQKVERTGSLYDSQALRGVGVGPRAS